MSEYRGFRITELHAICGVGDDDEEGVAASFDPQLGTIPLIGSDRIRLEMLKEMAQKIANETGRSFKVVRFSVREDVGEIKPKRTGH